jgi:trehalose 6-phosphate synthase/phosphatase
MSRIKAHVVNFFNGADMSRCLIVSNRLPLSYCDSKKEFVPSSGGLVSAIKGLDAKKVGYNFEWMGLITDNIDSEKINELKNATFGDLPCHPVTIDTQLYDEYYNNFCNNVLWPLFHYERSLVKHSDMGRIAYQEVNHLMSEAILATATDDDIIWIHDFHLFLVPGLLKKKRKELRVGFFLHIPFPSSEIFRELPQRKEILLSLIQCDLIGFHDLSYLNHFKSSLARILGESQDHLNEKKWGVYPISIDTEHFDQLTTDPETLKFIENYQQSKQQMKWILGVDRLDYIKGLILKLRSFQQFLRCYPQEQGKVQMLQIVIPSRSDVPEYKDLKQQIEQLVSSINGEFGSPTYMPIHYIFSSISEYELSALYQLSDVMHISSRRDGMNLVGLEYVISQRPAHPGTLLLSEFTGAHSTLTYAISINPWDVDETAVKIHEAIYYPYEKRLQENLAMQNFLRRYNSSDWARFFLRDLRREAESSHKSLGLPRAGAYEWMNQLKGKRVMLFCDLDGTLAPISSHPSEVKVHPETQEILKKIQTEPNLDFIVVSGRDREFLEEQFIKNNLNFPLAACHGAYAYAPEIQEWLNLIPHDTTRWKNHIMDILKLYTSRTPGSFIEDKGHAVTWHYRKSPTEFADFVANKLLLELEESLTNHPAQVSRGKKVIEVKSLYASKGYFIQHWLNRQEYMPDVIIAIGDDTTDEDMFQYLQEEGSVESYSIKVGREKSCAAYFIKDQTSVNQFLTNVIISINPPVVGSID